MWKSKHIFIHDYKLVDYFLKNDLLPFLDTQKDLNYFFIRYWNGGPHIRLRYKLDENSNDKELIVNIENILKNFREKYSEHAFEPVSYNKDVTEMENIKPDKIYPNYSIQDIEYEPEYQRYGGKNVMGMSEKLFIESSKFASTVIQNFEQNLRYSIVIDIMYECSKIAVDTGYCNDLIEFFTAYKNIWSRFEISKDIPKLDKVISRRMEVLDKNVSSQSFYSHYLNEYKKSLECIKKNQSLYEGYNIMYIAISHIHMLNNRLGVSPENEYRFSNIFIHLLSEKNLKSEDKLCGSLV